MLDWLTETAWSLCELMLVLLALEGLILAALLPFAATWVVWRLADGGRS